MPFVEFETYKILRDNFPLICADAVVVHEKQILLVVRTVEPFNGYWTIPGGHIDIGEKPEETAIRETFEESGIQTKLIGFVDLFADSKRDPWGHIISIAHLLEATDIPDSHKINSEVSKINWFNFSDLPSNIGFDHRIMIERAKLKYPNFF